MQSTVDKSKTFKAVYLEQLNQPNLSQEEIIRIQQQRQRLATQTAIFA